MQSSWFSGDNHKPFDLDGRIAGALLLHGFMGTPGEMRPLANALNKHGTRAVGPLLPGFGERISMIDKVSHDDWIREAEDVWTKLHDSGMADVLIGFSMGGVIAMHLAVRRPPRRLVLLAPLWKVMGGDWRIRLLPVLKHFVRQVQPFARADFSDPGIRQFFNGAMSGLDLDDPNVQDTLRNEVKLSTSTLDELRRLADSAGELSRQIDCETLIIQGRSDESVRLRDTRELVSRMGANVRLVEVDADHLLVSEDRGAWPEVRDLVLDFTGLTAR